MADYATPEAPQTALTVPPPAALPAELPKYHDVKFIRRKKTGRAVVSPVPPEEFGISRTARNIHDCGYCFHNVVRRQSDLVAEGWDEEQLKSCQAYTGIGNFEEQARNSVDERNGSGEDHLNDANREIQITEHYIVMDYDGDGKACLYRVTTGGSPSIILRRKQKDSEDYAEDIVKWEGPPPFACATPIIMPHRFFGRSIADLVVEIQRVNTALMRGGLDNIYMRNSPRVEVAESHAGINTLDDLLTCRPDGVIRTKQPGGILWQETPDSTQSVFQALQYMDARREWRTGVTRQGQGVDPNALQNQVATIANQMQSAAQGKMKMIARILAETGIKDLFSLLHMIIRRNGSQPQTIRLRGKWVSIDPRDWKARSDMTINVGLGNADRASQLAELNLLIGYQEKGISLGMVTKGHFFNSARELVRVIKPGADVTSFFGDPKAPPDPTDQPIPSKPDPKMIDAQTKMGVAKAKIEGDQAALMGRMQVEQKQAEADMIITNLKAQSEAMLEQQRVKMETFMAALDHKLEVDKASHKMQLDAMKAHQDAVLSAIKGAIQVKTAHAQMRARANNGGRRGQAKGGG